ncbi:NAD(P)H-quinone oxidoreductase [Thermoflexibacter ruber]|uniref:Putative NAD(P)H quinone oxidoreductase, PIG3 family n=1 Tax=Thermoflexibacter ruber TaxID=1003 RepID=A0A1I2HTP1_9BACT|nr:NAD(P)H-quinone oxidoreductase [Thermoflexibacter ruber]SFF32700.1 putative NAD(P)H quinone oxidoreductase, PIG3 family [Thermoflexibacter ruber]
MKAVLIEKFGSAENLKIGNWETPQLQEYEVLVKVYATALNRADLLQREGKYPPPTGASPVLGLEISGEVVALGVEVSRWKIGDKVFGLVPGGGYAQYAKIHEDMAIEIPENMTFETAAAIPEVFLTAYQALIWLAKLQPQETLLIHAGASGVGTAAIQIAKEMGAEVFVTASTTKHALCLELGAEAVIDYKNQDFEQEIAQLTHGQGVNVIIDFLAASYFQKNINSLSMDGRLVLLALLGGSEVSQVNLAKILMKRLQVIGSTLRSRSLDYQIRLTQEFWQFAAANFLTGKFKPIIDSIFEWEKVQEAHRYMESNQNAGKIVLKIR